jgi:hypothetical protein
MNNMQCYKVNYVDISGRRPRKTTYVKYDALMQHWISDSGS